MTKNDFNLALCWLTLKRAHSSAKAEQILFSVSKMNAVELQEKIAKYNKLILFDGNILEKIKGEWWLHSGERSNPVSHIFQYGSEERKAQLRDTLSKVGKSG